MIIIAITVICLQKYTSVVNTTNTRAETRPGNEVDFFYSSRPPDVAKRKRMKLEKTKMKSKRER